MNSKIVGAFLFAAGAAVGSVVTWKFVKTKYERIAQEEIDSVKEVFSMNMRCADDGCEGETSVLQGDEDDADAETEYEDPQDQMQELYEYESNIRRLGYASLEDHKRGGDEPVILAPYVISPDMYGEDGYETSMMTYYKDGVLEDDYWNVIQNVEDVIGNDFEGHFDEYEENTVFVRNERLRTDYEGTRDKRTYAESQQENPSWVAKND